MRLTTQAVSYDPSDVPSSTNNGSSSGISSSTTINASSNSSGGPGKGSPVVSFDMGDVKAKRLSNGVIVLDVRMEVDIVAAVKNGVNKVRLKFSKSTRDERGISQEILSSESTVKKILSGTSRVRKSHLENQRRVVKSIYVDITSLVDNRVASKIRSAGSREEIDSLLGSELVFESVSLENLSDLSSFPIVQVSRLREDQSSFTSPLKSVFNDMLFKDGLTVASATKGTRTYTSTEESVAGTYRKGDRRDVRSGIRNSRSSSDQRLDEATSRILGGNSPTRESAADVKRKGRFLRSEATVIDVKRRTARTAEVRSVVRLTRREQRALGNNFNLGVEVVNPDQDVIQTAGCCVDLIGKVLDSNFDPEIQIGGEGTGESDPSTNQNGGEVAIDGPGGGDDPGPTDGGGTGGPGVPGGWDFWVHDVNPLDTADGTGWEWMGSGTDQGETSNDFGSGGSVIVMRTTPRGYSPPSPSFSERIFVPRTRHLATSPSAFGRATAEVDNRFTSVTTSLRKDGIVVRVGGLQTSCVVAVVRRDLSLKEKSFSPLNVDQPTQVVSDTDRPVFFVDTDVKEDHIYEYRAKMFTRAGRDIFGTGNSVIAYQRLVENLAVFKVSKPKMSVNSGGDLDVRFSVVSSLSDTNISSLVSLLKGQGLDSFFTADLKENRNRLKKIVTYQIDRVDITKGTVESFNLFKGGQFSDRANRKLSNVSPLKMGHEYRYIVSLLARESESLIPSVTRTVVDRFTKNDYTITPSKHLHPSTLKNGTVRSETTIEKADYTAEFMAGFLGAQQFVNISTKTSKPKIVSCSCFSSNDGNPEITWRVNGQIRQIDHFVIIGLKQGMTSIVGRVHTASPNNSYRFIDFSTAELSGDTTYSVVPIFCDMTKGDPVSAGTFRKAKVKRKRV